MAERIPEWKALGFSSPETYADAVAASREMLNIEYLMEVQDKLPEGYKMNEGPGKVLTALGLYGDQTDNPQSSQPANIRSYTRPIGRTGSRTLGRYVTPYKAYNTYTPDLEEEFGRQLASRYSGIQAAMLGGPTQEDDVFADLTTQYNKIEGHPYEDTLKHELRHRGLASERVQDHLKQRGAEEKDVTAGRGEHELYELIRQLQVGEKSPEDLFMWDQRKLGQLEDLEAEILEGMTEEQRMRLGFLPEEPGFLDKLMRIMD
ncbi:MAG: hypothetical protein CMJ25_10810 [Phycisphaerae bacterium]|nr:hypothetical protein [Phycisphaerae bacterium]|tara:strand:+ start:97 stop:879 length:783 start_codon:yes stop_codon:yes gene_type:complete